MDLADAKRLKELERENAELKKMLAESMLKNRVLEEVNAKKWYARRRRSKPSPMCSAMDSATRDIDGLADPGDSSQPPLDLGFYL
jgi:hypothetical protein